LIGLVAVLVTGAATVLVTASSTEANSPRPYIALPGQLNPVVSYTATDPQALTGDALNTAGELLAAGAPLDSVGHLGDLTPKGDQPNTHQADSQDYQQAIHLNSKAGPWMQSIIYYAGEAGIPWQILYGLLNATSDFDLKGPARGGTKIGIAGIETNGTETSVDQANNPDYSIQFAAAQLADFYALFHDWGLALIAFHSGKPQANYLRNNGHPAAGTGASALAFINKAFYGLDKLGLDKTNPDMAITPAVLAKGVQMITLPDQATLRDTVIKSYKSIFFRVPTEQEIQAFMGVANDAVTQWQMVNANNANAYDQ
jgi:hypothetical protein